MISAIQTDMNPDQARLLPLRGEMCRRYLQGERIADIARACGCAKSTVRRALSRNKIDAWKISKSRARFGPKLTAGDRDQIGVAYLAGDSLSVIARRHSVCLATVCQVLSKKGIQRRPRGNVFKNASNETLLLIKQRWLGGVSQTKIGEEFGLTQANVSRLIILAGFDIEKRPARKGRSGVWNGGRSLTTNGYVSILLDRDDRYAAMGNVNGRVFEHRLTMAQSLGRCLFPWETVHHIDGDKQNNDLTNLQLRTGRHGKGVVLQCACCGSQDIKSVEIE